MKIVISDICDGQFAVQIDEDKFLSLDGSLGEGVWMTLDQSLEAIRIYARPEPLVRIPLDEFITIGGHTVVEESVFVKYHSHDDWCDYLKRCNYIVLYHGLDGRYYYFKEGYEKWLVR